MLPAPVINRLRGLRAVEAGQVERHPGRRWLLWILLVAFIWLVVARFTEMESLAWTFFQGIWQWVQVATLLQLVFYLLHAALYQATFYIVGIRYHLQDMLLAGADLPARQRRHADGGHGGHCPVHGRCLFAGHPAARAAAGTLLTMVVDFSAFSLLLIIGIIYLFRQAVLLPYQVVGSVLFLLFILLLSSLLLLGLWRVPALLHLVLILVPPVLYAGWPAGAGAPAPLGSGTGRPRMPPNISAAASGQSSAAPGAV